MPVSDTAIEGIWGQDEHSVTTLVNAQMAEMLGYTVEELRGHPVTDFMFEEDVKDYLKKLESSFQGVSGQYERRYRRKNGDVLKRGR